MKMNGFVLLFLLILAGKRENGKTKSDAVVNKAESEASRYIRLGRQWEKCSACVYCIYFGALHTYIMKKYHLHGGVVELIFDAVVCRSYEISTRYDDGADDSDER